MDNALAAKMGQLPDHDTLSQLPWSALLNLRNQFAESRDAQNLLAPYEHRAYMREYTDSVPSAAVNAMLTLGYTPYKMLTGNKEWSDPSMGEVKQGLLGVYEGLKRNRR